MHNLPDATSRISRREREHFDDYVEAVRWAQSFARQNRELMMEAVLDAVRAPDRDSALPDRRSRR